mmetsp:Transcript_53034/g.84165  ORF Transcript_53034/g.84165 Transcript_53034/m.84165 type:complete len:107 (-) Transcript_53034:175-495(-)
MDLNSLAACDANVGGCPVPVDLFAEYLVQHAHILLLFLSSRKGSVSLGFALGFTFVSRDSLLQQPLQHQQQPPQQQHKMTIMIKRVNAGPKYKPVASCSENTNGKK